MPRRLRASEKHLGKQNILKEGTRSAALPDPNGSEAPDAVLVLISTVANYNPQLSPVGSWKSTYNKSFLLAKSHFQILQPGNILIHRQAAVRSIARDGESKLLLVEDPTTGTTIRFSWHVFEVIILTGGAQARDGNRHKTRKILGFTSGIQSDSKRRQRGLRWRREDNGMW
ncbi:hypothetical protein GGX14DRAFT_401060 [Mycena pura]|uniref:Uncharacterized protein n=1 Tax=Mycena pura TaxID=153505 RepID=A0AAD6V0I2_9AGAR|nr:hypothetical protein GGX14DRAFT_401060 [Mycena pura]